MHEPQHYYPAVWVGFLYELLKKNLHDADQLLTQAGLNKPDNLDLQARVPAIRAAKFFELAAEVSNDNLLGFMFGAKADTRDLGLLWYLGVSSTTLSEALANTAHYLSINNDFTTIRLHDQRSSLDYPDTYLLEVDTIQFPSQSFQQIEEGSLCLFVRTIRLWTNTRFNPVEVTFKHFRTSRIGEMMKVFGCPVIFGADKLSLRLTSDQLKLRIPTSDGRLVRLLKEQGDNLLKEHQTKTAPFEHQVMTLVVELLSKGDAKSKVVSSELGMTERTLARRLDEIGTTYSEILKSVRQQLFHRYIKQQELTLGHITYLLGYSNTSAMNHAVKRWTGKTPMEYRNIEA